MDSKDERNNQYSAEHSMLKSEIEALKKELNLQLNLREKELHDYMKLQKKYEQLEKRYHALRSSVLGRITAKYWSLRKRLSSQNAKEQRG